jgi:hypothetical protein
VRGTAFPIFAKHSPAIDRELATAHFRIAVKHLMMDTAKREGISYIGPAKLKGMVETVALNFPVARGVPVDDVYNDRFLFKLFAIEKKFQRDR